MLVLRRAQTATILFRVLEITQNASEECHGMHAASYVVQLTTSEQLS